MSSTLVKDFAELQKIVQHLSGLGVDVLPEQVTSGIYDTWCSSKGYFKILLDDGVHYKWVKASNILEAASNFTAGSTGTGLTVAGTSSTVTAVETLTGDVLSPTGEVLLENVATTALSNTSISSTGLSTTASGAVAGNTGAGLVLTPKTAVVAAVLGALGFESSFVATQAIVNAVTGSDNPIEWNPFTALGEIVTYLTEDGKTYIPQDLVENIRQVLEDNGYFDNAITDNSFNSDNWINVPYFNLETAAQLAVSNLKYEDYKDWEADGFNKEEFNEVVDTGYTYMMRLISQYHSGNKVGYVNCSIVRAYDFSYRYLLEFSIISGDSDQVMGEYDPDNNIVSFTVNSNNYRIDRDNLGVPTHEYRTGNFNVKSLYSNIGRVNRNSLPRKQGAILPTPGTPLQNTYPNWYNNRLYGDNEENGKPHNKEEDKQGLLPITLPKVNPESLSQNDLQDGTNTDEDLDDDTKTQEDLAIGFDIPVLPPDLPIGDTPVILPPTSGSGTGLVKIYNPTLTTLASFSQWLWSSNIFDNFSKLFQDPMQAIIGLNLLYATPTRGTDSNIIVGNLDSNVSSRTVSSQYINIDCGTVTVNRYFDNALDYIDTNIECYLPFIGIVRLNASDMIGKAVNIKATVDVLTGTVLYNIYVGTQLLYTFNGTCAIQLPLTSANYNSIFSTLASIAGSAVSGFTLGGAVGAVGGAVAGGLTGIAGGGFGHSVERSGNIGSNAGAMGVKKPYLIITRHKPYNPNAYNKYYGYPANSAVQQLGSLSGYTRVKDVRVNGIVASSSELKEIESLLKEGVIL